MLHLKSHLAELSSPPSSAHYFNRDHSNPASVSVPVSDFLDICEFAKDKLANPLFSLSVATSTMLPSHGILGFLLKSCNNLSEVIKHGYRFQNISRSGCYSTIQYDALNAISILDTSQFNPEFIAPFVEYCQGNLFAIASELTGLDNEIVAKEIHFRHKPRASIEKYHEYLNAESILFSQPDNRVIFSRALMNLPLYISDSSMKDSFLKEAKRISNSLCGQQPTRMLIYQLLQQQTPFQLLTLEDCASQISISTSTLKRRLLIEKTSYQKILNEVRTNMACQLLSTSHLPIQDVSHQLGFSNAAAFSRAFKRWFRETPLQYRERTSSKERK